jgi:hypothetical protein
MHVYVCIYNYYLLLKRREEGVYNHNPYSFKSHSPLTTMAAPGPELICVDVLRYDTRRYVQHG